LKLYINRSRVLINVASTRKLDRMSPGEKLALQGIQEIAEGIDRVENRLKADVTAMCKLVLILANNYEYRDLAIKCRAITHFTDIYWSLKLHLAFHLDNEAANSLEDLQKVGKFLGLDNKELEEIPQDQHAKDPGSKTLEIVSVRFKLQCNIYMTCNISKPHQYMHTRFGI
jgi:hypothetical protein